MNRSIAISVRSWIWRIIPPFEVRLTVGSINAFFEEHSPLCGSIIMPGAITLARSAEHTVYSIRIDGKKPDELALILVCNVLGRYLTSGQHHTYRGVLSTVGNDMLDLWAKAIDALRVRGYYTEMEADDDMVWIRDQIKNEGVQISVSM